MKLSMGEPPASNYLDPALIADVVHEVNGSLQEGVLICSPHTAASAAGVDVAFPLRGTDANGETIWTPP